MTEGGEEGTALQITREMAEKCVDAVALHTTNAGKIRLAYAKKVIELDDLLQPVRALQAVVDDYRLIMTRVEELKAVPHTPGCTCHTFWPQPCAAREPHKRAHNLQVAAWAHVMRAQELFLAEVSPDMPQPPSPRSFSNPRTPGAVLSDDQTRQLFDDHDRVLAELKE